MAARSRGRGDDLAEPAASAPDSDAAAGALPKAKTNYTIEAVSSALDLLTAFEDAPHEFGISELARRLGMTKNQVFRITRTLEAKGFALRQPNGNYMLGARLSDLGRIAVRHHDIVRAAARSELDALADLSGETAYVDLLRDGRSASCLDVVHGTQLVRAVLFQGATHPLHASAGGKTLAAYMAEDQIEAIVSDGLARYTEHTLDEDQFRRSLALVRKRGYATVEEEYQEGADAVGAPVRNPTGEVVAAMCVVGPSARLRPHLHDRLPGTVIAAADRVTAGMALALPRRDGADAVRPEAPERRFSPVA